MPGSWLYEMSWSEVEEYLKRDDRIILPIGSTEQHGKFAPLGTDTLAAIALAEDASAQTGVLIAPPLWFGWSPHHLVRPGTITIRAEVLIEVLYDIIRSLAKHGFKKFVVINGHRIVNISWMQIAAERAQRELKVKVVIFDPAYMSKGICDKLGFGPVGHAEEIEISHMVYKYPNLVKLEKARDYAPEEKSLYHVDPRDPRDTLCYVPSTEDDMKALIEASGDSITGRPTLSSAEKGKKYHEHLVSRLIEVLEMLKG
ncbi:creatininase family protein [Thermococci archaeon]|nr:MAG: creatininase family protein [Thermococci archaeon]